jgi:hypothetical protein
VGTIASPLTNFRHTLAEFLMILHQVGLRTEVEDVAKLAWRFPADQPNVINAKRFLTALQPLCAK